MPKNFFDTLSLTTAAIPGVTSAVFSGLGGGLSQSVPAAIKASEILSDHSGQRDSLLKSLKALFDDKPELSHSVLDNYQDEIKDGLIATNDFFAFIARNGLLGAVSLIGHLSQLPSDASTIVQHTLTGLSNSKIPMDKVEAASKHASTFDDNVKGSSGSIISVTKEVSKQGGDVTDKIDKDIHVLGNSHAATHAKIGATGASGSIAATAILPLVTALVTDVVGGAFKETGALTHFSDQESLSKEGEKNVYRASSGVLNATQESDSNASQIQSDALEAALSDMQPAKKLLSNQMVSAPLATALLRLAVFSLCVESSRGVNKSAIATAEGRIQKALAEATAQGPSAGVDRIKSIHSNLSSLSNIMRLCAENLGGSPAVKAAAQSSEVISSRSMSVVLSHVSQLAEALRLLVNPPQEGEHHSLGKSFNSSVDSANKEKLAKSEATIKAVLDKIEQENGQHVIPGLNQDMASQLNTSARAGLASLLATHSIFINPTVLAIKGSKAASKIEEAQKNAALMETLPGMTQTLNMIQAFTRNLMDEMAKVTVSGTLKDDGALLAGHRSSASSAATVSWAASAILLLCDEMISICRSLTLIDQNRLQAASQKASEVPTKDISAQSEEQISWDSHSGQESSITHAVTALRLTLSHTGIALMKIALALHLALKDNMDTVKQNVAMHDVQKSLLSSAAYASQYLAEGLLLTTGAASAFPVSLNGSVNQSRQKLHTTDAHLHPEQTHKSENSSNGCTDSSQPTGFSTDMVAGTVTNILKVLAQGGLIGLDTILRLIKILEIISLHRDSHIALQLETANSSVPNGASNNILLAPTAGSNAGTSAVLINMLEALQTVDKSSDTKSTLNAQHKLKEMIDQQIEELAVLGDQEEERNNKKGLKEFYRVILRLLAPGHAPEFYEDLVKRLNYGGISLSNYHTVFGAYDNRPVLNLTLVSHFTNDDDAQGVLRHFIDKAKKHYPLLKSLHDALPENQRSNKATILYRHIYEEIFQHYKQVKMSDAAQHGARIKIPNRNTFEEDIRIIQAPLQEQQAPLQVQQAPLEVQQALVEIPLEEDEGDNPDGSGLRNPMGMPR
jgi:hypothetical protein